MNFSRYYSKNGTRTQRCTAFRVPPNRVVRAKPYSSGNAKPCGCYIHTSLTINPRTVHHQLFISFRSYVFNVIQYARLNWQSDVLCQTVLSIVSFCPTYIVGKSSVNYRLYYTRYFYTSRNGSVINSFSVPVVVSKFHDFHTTKMFR